MSAITRGRTAAAAGFLAASTMLGTALALAPAMQQDSRPVMQQDSRPVMQQDSRPVMQQDSTPAPWHDVTLTGMVDEARPGGMPSE